MMKTLALALVVTVLAVSAVSAASLADTMGFIRMFGDASSWMSSCFVVGDGSWIIASAEAITEKVGPETNHVIQYPLFVSAYTGQAYQCELKFHDDDLGIALLKLPVKGLPAAPLAKMDEFSKAAYGTYGQLMSGDAMGNSWPADIYGVTREKSGDTYRLVVGAWNAKKAFVTDIDKYKWLFLSDIAPQKSVPNGSIIARGDSAIGMYLSKMVITGGRDEIAYGRCVMSPEIGKYLGEHGVDSAFVYSPPRPTVDRRPDASAAFQLQAHIYSLIGAGKPALALGSAQALAKMRPDDPQAQMAKGVALTASGKFDDALMAFSDAAKLDSKLPGLRMNRALALIGLNKTEEAEAELTRAVEEAPADVRTVTALADFYLGDDKTFDKALTWAKKATMMEPASPAALLLMARVQKRLKNYQEAANTIGKALKMAPDWGEAWYALGSTYEEAGDKALAEKAYRTLAEKQPKNPDSLLTLASFLADTGKKDEALQTIGKIRDLKPPKPVLDAAQALEDRINGKEPDKAKDAAEVGGAGQEPILVVQEPVPCVCGLSV